MHRQLESAASDMARMAMDFADLGEQLQVGAGLGAAVAIKTCENFARSRFLSKRH